MHSMTSVKDLEAVFGAEPRLTKGEVRYVTRILQDGGILPKTTRGAWRNMPELTVQHCAAWLIGLAVTRRSGLRSVSAAADRVKRFMGLVSYQDPSLKFGDLLAKLIADYVNGEWSDDWLPLRFLIVNDDAEPRAELAYVDKTSEEFSDFVFVTPKVLAKTEKEFVSQIHTEFADAFVIGAEVLCLFREVFDREETAVA